MNGIVDESGRALIELTLSATDNSNSITIPVWINTAFTGELVVASEIITKLQLRQSGAIRAGLADGGEVVLSTYSCTIHWLDTSRNVEVIANEGKFPLLGIALLKDCFLAINYPARTLVISYSPKT